MNRKIRHALAQPFPPRWRTLLADRLRWWRELDADERSRLEDLVRIFLATKSFEGAAGFDPGEDVTVTIAAEASLLVLGLGHEWYRDVGAVIVYPSTAVRTGRHVLDGGVERRGPVALSGEAVLHGPVMVVWDAALAAARHPERGHNVVHHEFAHKLDMADGAADGMPPVGSRDREREWRDIMDRVLARLRAGAQIVLDPYGATNQAELFAVATEAFFEVPGRLAAGLPEVYELLASFYRQDPAARRARASRPRSQE
jgi:Mlc titration factor MtfA (ptsG expression regulator)